MKKSQLVEGRVDGKRTNRRLDGFGGCPARIMCLKFGCRDAEKTRSSKSLSPETPATAATVPADVPKARAVANRRTANAAAAHLAIAGSPDPALAATRLAGANTSARYLLARCPRGVHFRCAGRAWSSDHRTRSARKVANVAISPSMLARSSAAR